MNRTKKYTKTPRTHPTDRKWRSASRRTISRCPILIHWAWHRIESGGRVYTKHKCPSRKRDTFVADNIYILCSFLDTALSFSWLAQPEWTSQEHGIMF